MTATDATLVVTLVLPVVVLALRLRIALGVRRPLREKGLRGRFRCRQLAITSSGHLRADFDWLPDPGSSNDGPRLRSLSWTFGKGARWTYDDTPTG